MDYARTGRLIVYLGLLLAGLVSWLELQHWRYPLEALVVLIILSIWLPRMKPAAPRLAKVRLTVAVLFTLFALLLAVQKELLSVALLGLVAVGLALIAVADLRGRG